MFTVWYRVSTTAQETGKGARRKMEGVQGPGFVSATLDLVNHNHHNHIRLTLGQSSKYFQSFLNDTKRVVEILSGSSRLNIGHTSH